MKENAFLYRKSGGLIANELNKKIAVLGAGGLGSCLSLELGQRGYQVDVFEESSKPLRKASYAQEGKIHLGYIFAMDKTLNTARSMITGAIHFLDYLNRWVDVKIEDCISTPFYYLVHRGSLLKAPELQDHYLKCGEIFQEMHKNTGLKYLGIEDKLQADLLPKSQIATIANPEFIENVFKTNEYSLEPRFIANKITHALSHDPKIDLKLNCKVDSVEKVKECLQVNYYNDDVRHSERYDVVINTSWNGLFEIDRTMGIEPLGSWSHRYKFGNKVLIPFKSNDLPSCTMVLGPFGDTVNFKDKGAFMSWYPTGRTAWSDAHRPPDWDDMYSTDQRMDVFNRSFEELARRIPALQKLEFSKEAVDPIGGSILALGNTDVDNKESRLHDRFEVGIRSFGNYHTIDTGKFTLIPYLAVQAADRVEGLN